MTPSSACRVARALVVLLSSVLLLACGSVRGEPVVANVSWWQFPYSSAQSSVTLYSGVRGVLRSVVQWGVGSPCETDQQMRMEWWLSGPYVNGNLQPDAAFRYANTTVASWNASSCTPTAMSARLSDSVLQQIGSYKLLVASQGVALAPTLQINVVARPAAPTCRFAVRLLPVAGRYPGSRNIGSTPCAAADSGGVTVEDSFTLSLAMPAPPACAGPLAWAVYLVGPSSDPYSLADPAAVLYRGTEWTSGRQIDVAIALPPTLDVGDYVIQVVLTDGEHFVPDSRTDEPFCPFRVRRSVPAVSWASLLVNNLASVQLYDGIRGLLSATFSWLRPCSGAVDARWLLSGPYNSVSVGPFVTNATVVFQRTPILATNFTSCNTTNMATRLDSSILQQHGIYILQAAVDGRDVGSPLYITVGDRAQPACAPVVHWQATTPSTCWEPFPLPSSGSPYRWSLRLDWGDCPVATPFAVYLRAAAPQPLDSPLQSLYRGVYDPAAHTNNESLVTINSVLLPSLLTGMYALEARLVDGDRPIAAGVGEAVDGSCSVRVVAPLGDGHRDAAIQAVAPLRAAAFPENAGSYTFRSLGFPRCFVLDGVSELGYDSVVFGVRAAWKFQAPSSMPWLQLVRDDPSGSGRLLVHAAIPLQLAASANANVYTFPREYWTQLNHSVTYYTAICLDSTATSMGMRALLTDSFRQTWAWEPSAELDHQRFHLDPQPFQESGLPATVDLEVLTYPGLQLVDFGLTLQPPRPFAAVTWDRFPFAVAPTPLTLYNGTRGALHATFTWTNDRLHPCVGDQYVVQWLLTGPFTTASQVEFRGDPSQRWINAVVQSQRGTVCDTFSMQAAAEELQLPLGFYQLRARRDGIFVDPPLQLSSVVRPQPPCLITSLSPLTAGWLPPVFPAFSPPCTATAAAVLPGSNFTVRAQTDFPSSCNPGPWALYLLSANSTSQLDEPTQVLYRSTQPWQSGQALNINVTLSSLLSVGRYRVSLMLTQGEWPIAVGIGGRLVCDLSVGAINAAGTREVQSQYSAALGPPLPGQHESGAYSRLASGGIARCTMLFTVRAADWPPSRSGSALWYGLGSSVPFQPVSGRQFLQLYTAADESARERGQFQLLAAIPIDLSTAVNRTQYMLPTWIVLGQTQDVDVAVCIDAAATGVGFRTFDAASDSRPLRRWRWVPQTNLSLTQSFDRSISSLETWPNTTQTPDLHLLVYPDLEPRTVGKQDSTVRVDALLPPAAIYGDTRALRSTTISTWDSVLASNHTAAHDSTGYLCTVLSAPLRRGVVNTFETNEPIGTSLAITIWVCDALDVGYDCHDDRQLLMTNVTGGMRIVLPPTQRIQIGANADSQRLAICWEATGVRYISVADTDAIAAVYQFQLSSATFPRIPVRVAGERSFRRYDFRALLWPDITFEQALFPTSTPAGSSSAPTSSSKSFPLVIVVGSSRVDLQACKLEYSIVSPK